MKILKLAPGSFEFSSAVCGLPMGKSPKSVSTQFWDARQFWWTSIDMVQMLHIVGTVQVLHIVDMLQTAHIVDMLQMLQML